MAADQRKLLEQLMGAAAMGTGSSQPQTEITDPKVCRSYLAGQCPHDLFSNTKSDLGPCPKIHNEALKTEYENASEAQKAKWSFKYDLFADYRRFVMDCDGKIESAQRRLDKTADEVRQENALKKQIGELAESIDLYVDEIAVLGELDEVATGVMEHVKQRALLQRKVELERELRQLQETGGPSGHQKLQVCDVCGAYLSRLDNDRRLADHFYGKMHLGYATMRKAYAELGKVWGGQPPPKREFDVQRDDWRGGGGYGGGRGGGGRGGGRGGRGRGGGGFRGGRGRDGW